MKSELGLDLEFGPLSVTKKYAILLDYMSPLNVGGKSGLRVTHYALSRLALLACFVQISNGNS